MNFINGEGDSSIREGVERVEISIVIATFDRPAMLERCLSALLSQQCTRGFEIVVVDNHSQAGVTYALREKYPGIVWCEESVAGLSRARNRGIQHAQGAVIVTIDDDVITAPGWLEKLTTPLFDRKRSQLGATTGNCIALKLETEAQRIFEAYGGLRHGDRGAVFDAQWMARWRVCFPQLWRIGTTANAAFRASLFHAGQVGLFDTRLGAGSACGAWEDLDMFHRMLRAGLQVEYIPAAEAAHAHREDMLGLTRQLCAYRRGEMSFLTLALLRDHDLRALGQMLLWIPVWRSGMVLRELARRLRGRRQFPLPLLLRESLAYLAGPWALWRGHRAAKRS